MYKHNSTGWTHACFGLTNLLIKSLFLKKSSSKVERWSSHIKLLFCLSFLGDSSLSKWWRDLFLPLSILLIIQQSKSAMKQGNQKHTSNRHEPPKLPPFCLFCLTAEILQAQCSRQDGGAWRSCGCMFDWYLAPFLFMDHLKIHNNDMKVYLKISCFTYFRKRCRFRRALDVVLPLHNTNVPADHSEEMLSKDW